MHLNTISTLIVLTLLAQCHGNKNLQTKYEWKFMDFQYENDMRRQEDLDDQTFIPDKVIPVGIDVDEHRLFVTLPRLKSGVPASLATIDLNGNTFLYNNLVIILCVFEQIVVPISLL